MAHRGVAIAAARSSVAIAAILAACSSPEYSIKPVEVRDAAAVDARPIVDPRPGVDAGGVDAGGVDADGSIAPIVLLAGDLGAACTTASLDAIGVSRVYPILWDDAGVRHCHLFFANDPFQRSWADAKLACAHVSTASPARVGHLSTFVKPEEAQAITNYFKGGQIPWIGLSRDAAAVPADKASFRWVTGEPFAYDGWSDGTPASGACAAWRAESRWNDVACEDTRGFLCEIDE